MLTTEPIPLFFVELEIGQRLREVPLVLGIKFHLTSDLLASEVSLYPSGELYAGFCW